MTAESERQEQNRQIGGISDHSPLDAGQVKTMFLVPLEPLHKQHDNDRNRESRYAGRIRTGEQRRGTNALQIVPCLPDTVRFEDNPTDRSQKEGQEHLAKFLQGRKKSPFSNGVPVFPVLPHQDER